MGNLNNFKEDLDEFINLLATYPGEDEQIYEFVNELTEKISSKSNLTHYDIFSYHLYNKLSEFFFLSKSDILNSIQKLIVAIRNYLLIFDKERDLQIFIDLLKLKILALLYEESDFKKQLNQEVDELFIQFLEKISKSKDVRINKIKIKRSQFYEIKANILEFIFILFMINGKDKNDFIYKRLEELFIYFREEGFDVYLLGKMLGALILEMT